MIQAFINVFKIPELRTKVLFTIGMLIVYRIGFWIPIPGVNQTELAEFFKTSSTTGGALQRAGQFVAMFSGGTLSQSTIFGLGVMPYITASIIFQLFASASPRLKKLQEEGPTGRQKITEWTRYATIGLCVFQGFGWLTYITRKPDLVYAYWATNPLWWVMAIAALTAGSVFLMWLGEQIDRFGIGNGMSMIIMGGILTEMPNAVVWVMNNFNPGDQTKLGWLGLGSLIGGFMVVVCGAVILTVAQRRILIQQAKHTRGRKVFGGQRSYLPLRINHSGVMPVIFASSLMIFPSVIFAGIAGTGTSGASASLFDKGFRWLADSFNYGEFPYICLELVLIFFFSYFWITVQFNPEEMSKQLRDHGSFIPGLRPGPRTAEYLETVMERITFVGAGFLSVIAVLPMLVSAQLNVPSYVSQFLGGTGLLITVSVCLDFVQRVEANLLMRNYAGFLGGGDDGKGPRIRGPRS